MIVLFQGKLNQTFHSNLDGHGTPLSIYTIIEFWTFLSICYWVFRTFLVNFRSILTYSYLQLPPALAPSGHPGDSINWKSDLGWFTGHGLVLSYFMLFSWIIPWNKKQKSFIMISQSWRSRIIYWIIIWRTERMKRHGQFEALN